MVARIGGDEFAILLNDISEEETAATCVAGSGRPLKDTTYLTGACL